MKYRVYSPSGERIGYADEPQYPGQCGHTHDYDAACHCGARMKSWSVGSGARCGNGHDMPLREIAA
jgi:hypothetical protein